MGTLSPPQALTPSQGPSTPGLELGTRKRVVKEDVEKALETASTKGLDLWYLQHQLPYSGQRRSGAQRVAAQNPASLGTDPPAPPYVQPAAVRIPNWHSGSGTDSLIIFSRISSLKTSRKVEP